MDIVIKLKIKVEIKMNKQKIKKFAIPVLVILVFIVLGFGINKYNKVRSYNNLITAANKYMNSGEYDKAEALFKQSLEYKDDPNVESSIKLAENLKMAKSIYDNGLNLMNNKDYDGAIQQFQKITKEDDKLYSSAQKKIAECKKSFISQNIESANNAIKNDKYDEASKYIDNVLKMDSNNAEAKKLKDSIDKSEKDQQSNQTKQTAQSTNSNTKVTAEEAADIALSSIKDKVSTTEVVKADEVITNQNGVNYYVIHVADNMGDHVATRGWYYVEVNTGKLYKCDMADSSKLVSVN